MTGAVSRAAVFLDRDGTLNALVTRDGAGVSPRRIEDFRLLDGVAEALKRFREAGFLVFVVTNQPDLARGYLTREELERMHRALTRVARIDEISICPHDDADQCGCRKPKPGMILDLARRWNVELPRSYVVGDSWKDIDAGRRAGCRTILVRGGDARGLVADWLVESLEEAAEVIQGVASEGRLRWQCRGR
ncbi:MAG: HAD family hydrolase [Gemmatimonadetes bacterium]|nr:HAD family hydrolase [Gemmatimonadota bacterium]